MLEMFNALISGFVQCFSYSTFTLMLIGVAIGFVVGILPGLGGPTAMALMLPFVLKLAAAGAFAFCLVLPPAPPPTEAFTSFCSAGPGDPPTPSTLAIAPPLPPTGETAPHWEA